MLLFSLLLTTNIIKVLHSQSARNFKIKTKRQNNQHTLTMETNQNCPTCTALQHLHGMVAWSHFIRKSLS